jgi:predicted dehydrogenase
MNAGKSVLCEKPVAVNKDDIVEMVECARRNNVFFMEAMWTRHFPVNRQVKELLESGNIGKVTLIKVDFGFGSWVNGAVENKESRIFNMDLAGGALLDVGVYTTSYATWMKGEQPIEIKAMATKVETGADGMSTYLFKYQDGAMAMLESSVMQTTKHDAIIYCENGYIEVEGFWHPTRAVVRFNDGRNDLLIEDDYDKNGGAGFDYEAQHVIDCMNEGLKESPVMSWQDSIDVMDTLDKIREQIDLVYPFENKK